MPRAAQLSVRGFGHRWRGGSEMFGGLGQRLFEGLGVVLVLASLLVLLALLTYNPGDVSLNTAIDAPPRNFLGHNGALIADVLVQSFGLAAYLVPSVMFGWAFRLLLGHPVRRPARGILLLLLALVLGAASCSILHAGLSLPAGAGGAVGWVVLGLAKRVGLGAIVLPLAMAAAALVALLLVSIIGLSPGDWRDLGSGAGRGATRFARASGRGTAATAAFGHRLVRRWRQARLARRATVGARPATAGVWPPQSAARSEPRARSVVTPLPDRREPQLGRAPINPGDAESAAGRLVRLVMPRAKPGMPGRRGAEEQQPGLDLVPDQEPLLPPLSPLTKPPAARPAAVDEEALAKNARMLEAVLEDYGVRGRTVIGIELPNLKAETVYLRELLDSPAYEKHAGRLVLGLGKDIGGEPVIADLARMPHLLIAGTTGSGKSVGINTMILSILYRMPPERCKFIMVDPKMLELSVYDGIPHLLAPVVTDPKKAVLALKWTVREMESRYQKMSKLGVRNIEGFNQRLRDAAARGESLIRKVQTGFDPESGHPIFEEQPFDATELPLLVVVVDEMADLMMVAGKEIEAAIQRLAQMARAAGIHIIMATQRPSVDVITGTIKANFPTRISFQVTSKIDSRTILGEGGAEQLLGRGDMLYMAGGGRVTRVHGPFVSDEEVERVVSYLKSRGAPDYVDEITEDDAPLDPFGGDDEGSGDGLYDQAVALVCRERKASTSFVQRHLQIGYNRAARLIERMEAEGVVSTANHVGKREVLAPPGR